MKIGDLHKGYVGGIVLSLTFPHGVLRRALTGADPTPGTGADRDKLPQTPRWGLRRFNIPSLNGEAYLDTFQHNYENI